jgi:hypothetical protein
MKTIKFAADLVPLVLSGEKTSTWRLFDDKALKTGDVVEFWNKQTLEKFADATLLSVEKKPLRELTDEDKIGHETFESDEEMYATYSGYYNREVTPETPIKIIRFKLLH